MTLLEAVEKARAERRTLSGGRDWGVGLEEAYRIQEALFPGPLKGYKLGLVSEAKQRQMGIAEPIFGRCTRGCSWSGWSWRPLSSPASSPRWPWS